MANPVITDAYVVYPPNRNGYKLPGETATVTVKAIDADGLIIQLALRVIDSQGNTSLSRQVEIVQNDELRVEVISITERHTASVDPINKLDVYVT